MGSLEQGLEFISGKNNIKQLVEEIIKDNKNTNKKEGYTSLDRDTLNKMKADLDISRTMMSAQSGIWTIGLVIVVLLVIKETSKR
tara:strand:+ start:569 stop:823 length:255 start_codon:yes stop_codon:yes gene_type:complete